MWKEMTVSVNPFVPPAPQTAPQEDDAAELDAGQMNGPASPAVAPEVQGEVVSWPQREVERRTGVFIAGLHGGAGASTLSQLLNLVDGYDAYDAGQGWPVAAGWTRPRAELNVIAVYRPTRAGIAAATHFARAWAASTLPDSRLLGIVAIDDGPKLLAAQKNAVKRIGHMTPHGWHIGWHEPWRISAPEPSDIPRSTRRTLRSIHTTIKKEGVQ